jgi:hypothetical protein
MAKQKLNSQQSSSELGYAEVTSGQGSITNTTTDLTGLTTTVTTTAGMTIIIEGWIPEIMSTVASDRADFSIWEGGTAIATAYANTPGGSSYGWGGAYVRARIQPSAGSHTYKLRLVRGIGSGTLSTYADSSTRAHIQVRTV